jgi:hypothetical protein
MEPLLYDPRTKQQIKDALWQFLYQPVKEQFAQRLLTLIQRNTMLGGYSHNSFRYKGEFYSDGTPLKGYKWNNLLPALRPEMDAYLKEVKELNDKEIPYVIGFINQVLNASNDLNDYLRLLPPSVHAPIYEIIAACPCRHTQLSPEKVLEIKEQNKESIALMKQRQVINLLT